MIFETHRRCTTIMGGSSCRDMDFPVRQSWTTIWLPPQKGYISPSWRIKSRVYVVQGMPAQDLWGGGATTGSDVARHRVTREEGQDTHGRVGTVGGACEHNIETLYEVDLNKLEESGGRATQLSVLGLNGKESSSCASSVAPPHPSNSICWFDRRGGRSEVHPLFSVFRF